MTFLIWPTGQMKNPDDQEIFLLSDLEMLRDNAEDKGMFILATYYDNTIERHYFYEGNELPILDYEWQDEETIWIEVDGIEDKWFEDPDGGPVR